MINTRFRVGKEFVNVDAFMDVANKELERLRSENEKLAVDSVALNEVISVVRNWNRELRSNTLVRMKQIVDIVEERDD